MVGANGGLTDAASGSGADRGGILSTHAHLFFLLSSGLETCSWRPGSISGKKAASGASSAAFLIFVWACLIFLFRAEREKLLMRLLDLLTPMKRTWSPAWRVCYRGPESRRGGIMKRLWWQQSRSRSGAGRKSQSGLKPQISFRL